MKKINLNQMAWRERKSPKGRYHLFYRDVARAFEKAATGPKLPGEPPFEFEVVRLPAGARNFPFHWHSAEWEFYFIASGKGRIRAGKLSRPIRTGDCVLNPPGEAHQIINTGKKDLVYYVVANNSVGDFWHYPDSDKWGVWAPFMEKSKFFRLTAVTYHDGEE